MFFHGLMFHHFHDQQHPKGQGSINADQLNQILDRYDGRIVSATDWLVRSRQGTLKPTDVCLTFDDALKCQINVALPVLQSRGLTAFWFVYSSVFQGNAEPLEIFRYFRTVAFENFDDFCDQFMTAASDLFNSELVNGLNGVDIDGYLPSCAFYSYNDRLYRFVRDHVLSTEQYDSLLNSMMTMRNFDVENARKNLWMVDDDLKRLSESDHIVGLHSYSHPIRIERFSEADQLKEYRQNYDHLSSVIGASPVAMSHPCNSYNGKTIGILSELGIHVGFRADLAHGKANSPLEIPREDHANILAAMQ